MQQYVSVVKKRMVAQYPAHLLGGKINGGSPKEGERGHAHVFRRLEDNFPDGRYPTTRRLKGNVPDEPIPYHHAEHLHSAQTMCISYFKKFFEQEPYERYLTESLETLGLRLEGSGFSDGGFAHCPNPEEGTVFDCYLRLTSGKSLYWNTRFTESTFGSLPRRRDGAERYVRDWEEVYTPLLRQCVYHDLPDMTCEAYCCLATGGLSPDCPRWRECPIYEFYQYPQIRRSILHATRKGDYVLFLSPLENRALERERAYIHTYARRWGARNIRSLYWEQLISVTLQTVRPEQELLDYYAAWKTKYFG